MKTIQVNLYEIDELEGKAKDKAIEWYRNLDTTPFLADDMRYKLDDLLSKKKIKVVHSLDLSYSLSNCQGDGVMFEGLFEWKHYVIRIKHRGHYYHSKCKEVIIETNRGHEAKDYVYDDFEVIYQEICGELEKYGYSIIDEANSDDSIIDNIKCNEYTFLSNGVRFMNLV